MATPTQPPDNRDLLDVRRAAALVGRHPETVRRWIWSGRLAAQRRGNRLLVARDDLEAMAGRERLPTDLADWAKRAQALRAAGGSHSTASAAELVIEDRATRSAAGPIRAGR